MEENEIAPITKFANKLYRLINEGFVQGFRVEITEPGTGLYYLDVVNVKTGEREPVAAYRKEDQ